MASGFAQGPILLLAPDASGLLVVVSSVRRESALLGEACSDATGGGAEDASLAGADATTGMTVGTHTWSHNQNCSDS